MLSGEAGPSIEDKIEVLHTIDNRVASPLFPNTLHDVITAENQYNGYNPNNLVTDENLKLIDWYYSQKNKTTIKQPIPNCNRYYFVTGIKNICNKFEISSEGSQGRWVSFANKNYDEPGHYCPTAMLQAEQYRYYCMTKQGQIVEFVYNR